LGNPESLKKTDAANRMHHMIYAAIAADYSMTLSPINAMK
jgi:hypothetical protein